LLMETPEPLPTPLPRLVDFAAAFILVHPGKSRPWVKN